MRDSTVVPPAGEVFLDPRGGGRALRVSWHDEAGVVVLSLWRSGVCTGTFRLPVEEVPGLVDVLRRGLAQAYRDARATDHLGDEDGQADERTGALLRDPLRQASEV